VRLPLAMSVYGVFMCMMASLAVAQPDIVARLPSNLRDAAHAESQASDAPDESGQNRYALLIGINHYLYPDRVSSLAGSLNDVQDMRQVLIGKFNVPPGNIAILAEAQATHAGSSARSRA